MEADWEDIPDLALQRILEHTDFQTRKTARLVCKRWKDEIQSVVGLVVNINDSRSGLTHFVQVTLIHEANMSFLCRLETLDRLSPARALIFSSYVSPPVFRAFLDGRTWNKLTRLFFCGSSLISQDWRDTNDEAPVGPAIFPYLKELEIRLSVGMISMCGIQLGKQHLGDRIPLGMDTWDRVGNIREALGKRAVENVRYLMKSIQSPVLSSFFLSATPFFENNGVGGSTSSVNEFLEAHAKTLDKLVLQQLFDIDNRFYGRMEIPLQPRDFPLRWLKSLLLSRMPNGMRENFVRDLILTQEALEDLDLEFEDLPYGSKMTEFLVSLVKNTGNTLKYFSMAGMASRRNQELDLLVFKACRKLRILKLAVSNGSFRMQVKNVNELPASLEEFQAGFGVGTTHEFNGVRFIKEMRNLEVLSLHCIQKEGHMGRREHTHRFIQAALRHRRLCTLDLKFKLALDHDLYLETSLGDLESHGAKSLFNLLLGQIFDEGNMVEFDTFYAGIGRDSNGGNYRHFFEVAGNLLWYSEQIGPFNVDHRRAKSYSVTEGRYRDPGGRSLHYYSLHSVAPSEQTVFDLDARAELESEVWIDSKFHVEDSRKLKKLDNIYRKQKWNRKERGDLGDFIPVPKDGSSGKDSDGEQESLEVQKDGLPAFEVSQHYAVRIVKKIKG